MQVETAAQLACPLCKLQFPDSSEEAPSTRLCPACQTMVLAAFRGSSSIIQSAAVVTETVLPPSIQSDEQAFDHGLAGAQALFELTPVETLASELQSRPPLPFDAPEPVRFDFYQDEDSAYKTFSSPTDLPDLNCGDEAQVRTEFFEGSGEAVAAGDCPQADEPHLILPSAGCESAIESTFDAGEAIEERFESPSPNVEQVGADEWQTSVATWDPDWDSNSEWPLLVAPSGESTYRKRLAMAAVAAIAILAVAAGFYFLVYRSSDSQEQRVFDAGTKASTVEPRAASVGSSVTASLAPVVQPQSDSAAAARPAEGPSTDSTAKGQFSLQAASFPTQEGADEFAERLRRAGVASYVVPAELIRRGRWFRVRVGRFNSAEDAQRFVGEAQQRARAAGMAVQLIVCQYGQP